MSRIKNSILILASILLCFPSYVLSIQDVELESFKILLVNDNSYGTERYLVIDTTISNLGYTHDVFNTVTTGTNPTFTLLSTYDLVIWYTGNDGVDLYLWDTIDSQDYKFNNDLINYINNGGNVWLQGLDFMYDIKGMPPNEFSDGQFIHDYMGITKYVAQSYVNDNGVGLPQLDAKPFNPVCTFTPIKWVYSTLWHADAFDVTSSTRPIYFMGPSDYILQGYSNSFINRLETGTVMTWAFETARINTRENTETIFSEVFQYYESLISIDEFVTQNIKVSVFPNPVHDKICFEFKHTNKSDIYLSIFDVSGKLLLAEFMGEQLIETGVYSTSVKEMCLKPGVYLYRIKMAEQSFSGRIMVN